MKLTKEDLDGFKKDYPMMYEYIKMIAKEVFDKEKKND